MKTEADSLADLLAEREKLQAAAAALDARRAKLEPFRQALEKAQRADAELVAADARRMREWIDAGATPPAPRPQDRSKTLAAVDAASAQYAAAQAADRDLQQDGVRLAQEADALQRQIAMAQSRRLLDQHASLMQDARKALLAEITRDQLATMLANAAERCQPGSLSIAGKNHAEHVRKALTRGELAEAERKAHLRFAEFCAEVGL